MLLISKNKSNKDENLFLRPINQSVTTVATNVEEDSGEEVRINRENILRCISKKKGNSGTGGNSEPTYLRGHCAKMSHESRHRHDVDEEWPNEVVRKLCGNHGARHRQVTSLRGLRANPDRRATLPMPPSPEELCLTCF